MSDKNTYERTVGSRKYLRGSVREIIEIAEQSPNEWHTLKMSNKRGTAHLTVEIIVEDGKPRFRLLGQETRNKSKVYDAAKRELSLEARSDE